MKINPYLHFNGNCEVAFKAYAELLGAEITMMMTYGDAPAGMNTSEETRGRIMHAALDLGGTVLMGSDAPPPFAEQPAAFSVSLVLQDPEQANRIFTALAEGGEIRMQIQETFWAARFGMLKDRFGTPWMINCEKPS